MDADALLARKGTGKEAKLSYSGHVLMENRNGLAMDPEVLQATGKVERDAWLLMAEAIPGGHRVTLGADKNYDTKDFVAELRNMKVTPHVAQNQNQCRRSRLTAARHATLDMRLVSGSVSAQKKSSAGKKTIGGMGKLRHHGLESVRWMFTFAAAAYNLVHIRNLTTPVR